MKTSIILFLLILSSDSYGQDGSDILYRKVQEVDTSLIGRDVQFDFFHNSFGGSTVDTVTIPIDGTPIRFVEVRKDDGLNSWFYAQRLQSIDKPQGLTIEIPKFRLRDITRGWFQATIYAEYFDASHKELVEKARQFDYWFDKEDIIEVLVKDK